MVVKGILEGPGLCPSAHGDFRVKKSPWATKNENSVKTPTLRTGVWDTLTSDLAEIQWPGHGPSPNTLCGPAYLVLGC